MTKESKGTPTSGSLPTNHFAILFEGAWIFTPDYLNNGILATCPLADDGMHAFEFGIWDNHQLNPLPPFETTCFPMEGSFGVAIDPEQIRCEERNFNSVFDKAARKYPFVYLPSSNSHGRSKGHFVLRDGVASNGRTVSLPIPTSVRAAGALISAEVRGPGASQTFGGTLSSKRTFVTFLFLYEYDYRLDAEVELKGSDPTCGEIHADQNLHPHLIFRVRPANMGQTDPCAMLGHESAMPAPQGESGDKVHVITIFDQLRTSLPNSTRYKEDVSDTCCDILVYHDQGEMIFDDGDTGLFRDELGIKDPPSDPRSKGSRLPACAGGGIVSGGTTP